MNGNCEWVIQQNIIVFIRSTRRINMQAKDSTLLLYEQGIDYLGVVP